MHRHSRAHARYHRERIIAKRRRMFACWLDKTDSGVGTHQRRDGYYALNAPRPLPVRAEEFWTPRRVGMLAKWNTTCDCGMCKAAKASDRAWRRRREAVLIGE